MISPKRLKKVLSENKIDQFIGVPDSVLKNFLEIIPEKKNFISNNEGSAVAYGIGYHLSTKKLPLVYMQNSGLGNAINPLISIAHKNVYSIPLVLLIGEVDTFFSATNSSFDLLTTFSSLSSSSTVS